MQQSIESFLKMERMLNTLPVFKAFGAELSIRSPGEAIVKIANIADIHLGGFQSTAINGMVIMGMLDSAMCAAAISQLDGKRSATVEISVKFIKAVIAQPIEARGIVLSRSRDIFYCQAAISDSSNNLRALATGVVKEI